jgi:hypothetical protein
MLGVNIPHHLNTNHKENTMTTLNTPQKAILVGGFGLFFGLAALSFSDSGTDVEVSPAPTSAATEAPVATEAPTPVPTEAPVLTEEPVATEAPVATEEPAPVPTEAPAPAVSAEYRNAVSTADSYLEYSSFSRESLIGQLEYEGYPTAAATYAVDNVPVDWDVQAALSAISYLEYSSFSRESLADQLDYEGFTSGQVEFAMSYVVELGLV